MLYAIICWNVAKAGCVIYLPWGPAVSFSISVKVGWARVRAGALTNIPVAGSKKLWHISCLLQELFLGRRIRVAQVLKFPGRRFAWQEGQGAGESGCSASHIYLYWKHNTPFAHTVSISLLSLAIRFDSILFWEFFRMARDKTQLMPALKFTLPG